MSTLDLWKLEYIKYFFCKLMESQQSAEISTSFPVCSMSGIIRQVLILRKHTL